MTLIPFDDRDGYIWMDGRMLPWREAKLHVLSHGLHYGGSVFEGERVYEGETFKLHEHSARLIKSAEYLDMKIDMTAEALDEVTREVIEANSIAEGYVRPVAWRGAEQLAISGQLTKIHVAIACWQWPKYFFPKGEDGGIALRTSGWRRPDPSTAPVQSKAAGIYMIGTISKHEAERAGFDDVLMLDYKGRVAESSGANLFMVKDGALFTPDPECFLNGITRQTVLQLAQDMGYKATVTTIMPDELLKADEIFVTGTAAEITPVSRIDETSFKVGKVTKEFQDAYHALVRRKAEPQRQMA
jgi:branched-chain amino acid aminotransferase